MNGTVMFLDCPEYMDDHDTVRCGLPAAVEHRYLYQKLCQSLCNGDRP